MDESGEHRDPGCGLDPGVRVGREALRLAEDPPVMMTLSLGVEMEREKRALQVGLVLGLIAYASVAMLYAAIDLVAGRGALYTVDLLGKFVFLGLRDPAVLRLPMEPDFMAIFWYNGLHLVASVSIGLIVAGLVKRGRRQPRLARLALFTIVAGYVVTIVAVGLATSTMRWILPWWSIVVSNTLAVAAAGSYLLWKWPDTWERLSPFGG